jgi:hypothetical protein
LAIAAHSGWLTEIDENHADSEEFFSQVVTFQFIARSLPHSRLLWRRNQETSGD